MDSRIRGNDENNGMGIPRFPAGMTEWIYGNDKNKFLYPFQGKGIEPFEK
jgi:hypothetical protein